ncbi:MAG: radical SAM family heme chaperone HemW [Bacteroidota bacterium]
MGGIYLHIPFCRKACIYCDFHFSTNFSRKKALLDALRKEIDIRKNEIQALGTLNTLYFGGGTPSVLHKEEVLDIINHIRDLLPFSPEIEINLEANPDDLKLPYLESLSSVGINRLSIGIQSFSEDVLKWMNRSHNSQQSTQAIEEARIAGFENFSCDLIFGNPGIDQKLWEKDLQQLIDLKSPHISVYALTVEERTALSHQVENGKAVIPPEEIYQDQFLIAHQRLTVAGYEHYELSNYAIPGFRSKHNSAYWKGIPYVGLGPSAHSYDGKHRSWNIANNMRYIQQLDAGESPVEESELLSPKDQYHEYIMTHLRKMEGIDMSWIEKNWVPDWRKRFEGELNALKARDEILVEGQKLWIKPEAWLLSNQIIRDFFIDDIL